MEISIASVNRRAYFSLFAILLFFFNSALLGGKLSLVLLLSPLWLYLCQASKAGLNKGILAVSILLILYIPIHFYVGLESAWDYFRSLLMILSLILFINAAIYYLKLEQHQLDGIFRQILIINTLLTVLSIAFLFIPSLKPITWYVMSISEGIAPMPRLKLFTPEASHYSLIFSPIFIYFTLRWLLFRMKKPLLTLFMICIPLILSFSLGVLAVLFISLLLLFTLKYRSWFKPVLPPVRLLLVLIGLGFLLLLIYYVFPENPLYTRLENLLEGTDTSGRGRTYEAFILADKIAALKSKLWGIGPGQLKLIGREIIVQFYYYTGIPEVVRIPNASAETIACYGYIGFAIRLLIEWILFVKTKVWNNPFRLWLFLFLFIYQLTGSYITNAYEYILWILAFSPIFKDMNQKKTIG